MSTELPTSTLAQRLAAYIPATLTRQILAEGLPTPGQPRALQAATMFTDMSGFTAMSEELASDGARGAEEVNRVLLLTFTGMIDLIHSFGGAISHFYGDAMSVYFPDEDGTAAKRALACAQQMQQLMRVSFNRVGTNRPPGKEPFFKLTMKVGLGYGDCQELIVGTPESLEFVLTGTAVDEAAEAEKQAEAGQVIASRTILQQAGLALAVADAFGVLDDTAVAISTSIPILNWSDYNEADLQQLVDTITPFIPPALYERLTLMETGEISLGMAEHRPVTSLFVQFEYAGDEDESSAIATAVMGQQLQAYYVWACEVVARFGQLNARVNRVLTGDKGNQLHIMFGAPVAPDAPDQAIRCALALQRERPSTIRSQRIGLAAGKVFAGPVGSASRREYTVVGDVVNLSARLMQACTENAVYTDHVTANRSGSAIEFETLEPIKMKGKQEAVTPYRPLRDQTTSHLHAYFGRWERPLVGRDVEQKLLHDGLETAVRGRGGVFALYGATGAGKSHLLSTGVKQWLDAGGTVLVGVCQPQLADVPFGPWRGIWQDFFDLQAGMSLPERIAAIQQRTAELVPGSADEVGLWADVTGLPIPPSERLQQLTAEARQTRLYALMRRCLQAAAAQRPLFLIIEDVHWSDQSTLDWIDELTSSLADYHVYLALTFRDQAEVNLATMQRPLCTSVKLGDLSPDDARKIVAQTVGATDLPASVEQHLGIRDRDGRESKVSPLFLDEALKMMVVGGVFEPMEGNRVRVNEGLVARMQVPDTIHGLLLARLDRLSPGSRDLLQVASVIGRQFSVEPLDTITPLVTRPTIAHSMSELTTEQIMQLVTADPDETYLFQQALTHEVAYESLPFARRQVLHGDVAAWLQERYEDNLLGQRHPFRPRDSLTSCFSFLENCTRKKLAKLANSQLDVSGELA
jgi:class 3 adenylate cyclase